MLLTIGMIVKNEEKYLDRCLSAIKPILDNVDSELIITDTGSTDKTVEIAQRYTDNVLYFDWVNDFAAARNTGIKAACGEWFMFLDADEIFCSCNGIIDFFVSGNYRKYNYATFVIRNLHKDGSGNDFFARRLTKITANTRFEGVIHEHFTGLMPPVAHLNDIALHYGYIYSNETERIKKFDRNCELMKRKFEENRNTNPMVYAEMYDLFATGFRQKEADRYLEEGIEWCKGHRHPLLVLMFCKKARHLLFQKQNSDALAVCDEYLGMSREIRPSRLYSDIEIYAIKATVYHREHRHDLLFDCLKTLFGYYDDIRNDQLNTDDRMFGAVNLGAENNYYTYVAQLLLSVLSTGEFEKGAQLIAKLPLDEYAGTNGIHEDIIILESELLLHVDSKYIGLFMQHLDKAAQNRLSELIKIDIKQDEVSEFDMLASKVKSNIKTMIENGDISNAKITLENYIKLVPNDKDIVVYRDLISKAE